MRFVKLAVMLGGFAALQIPQLAASSPFFEEPPELNILMSGGFREDDLKFHIGGDKPHPKVFSKVQWKNLKIAEIGASINYSTCNHYYMRASGDYGKIMRGRGSVANEFSIDHHRNEEINHHHHDLNPIYHKKGHKELSGEPCFDNIDHHHERYSNAHHEFSKQKADAGYGYVYDFSGGVGYKVVSAGGRGWIAGIVGYSYNRQNLKMRHFEQKKDSRDILKHEDINNLRGSYLTSWSGAWIGFDASAQIECEVTAFATAEWHQVNFRGKGKWSNPGYSGKFRHHAPGYGAVGTLGFDWRPCDKWGFGVVGEYQQWSTRKGNNHGSNHFNECNELKESSHLISTFPIAEKSKLLRVKWISYSVSAVVTYRY
ncbi:MAG: hypothetical protein H0T62_10360 [Parachlamydiaceae bacterium]|nr:hypothetical protein [Parachlamydiaceae bacterium]